MKNFWRRLVYAFKSSLRYPSLYPAGRFANPDIEACVDNYVRNMKTARYHASLLGAKYFNFLQPFNGCGRSKMSRFDVNSLAHIKRRVIEGGETQHNLELRFFDRLWERVQDEEGVFDLREMFKDHPGEIYFDHVHFSDTGYDLIAKRMAEEILKAEEATEKCPQYTA